VKTAEDASAAGITRGATVMLTLEHLADRDRRQRARQAVRGEHRKDDSEPERREQIFGRPFEKDDRSEDAADRQRRHECRHSDFGSTTVGKLTSRYDFTPGFALRGTVSNGFRAPTLAEEYYSATNVGPSTAFVQLPPNSQGAALLGLGDGLQPEKSKSFSIGFVYVPLKKMSITLDLYQTNIKNRIVGSGVLIGTSGGEVVSQQVTDAIVANGNVLDSDVVATGTTGVNIFANGIDTRTRGADLAFEFPSDYRFGHVNWIVAGTYNQTSATSIIATPAELSGQTLFDLTATSDLTTASPKYVVNFGAAWTYGKYTANLIEKVYGPAAEYETDFGDATGTQLYYQTKIGITPITRVGAPSISTVRPMIAGSPPNRRSKSSSRI